MKKDNQTARSLTFRISLLLAAAHMTLSGCRDPGRDDVERKRQAVVTAFATGSLVVPMDTGASGQNSGMLRAYGLVYALLKNGVPVQWAVQAGKAQDGVDFTATCRDVRTGASLGARSYGGGPFVVAAADAPAALPIVNAWLSANAGLNVHEAQAGFSADIARVLIAAPRIAVFRDGNQAIAYTNLNAAGITDGAGLTWADTSADALTEAQVIGASTTNHADGALLAAGAAKYCHFTSMHPSGLSNTTEVVAEVRSWLDTSALTHGFMECQATATFENQATYGFFVTTGGLTNDGGAGTIVDLDPDDPLTQYYGALTADGGSVASMRITGGTGNLRPNTRVLINRSGDPLDRHVLWLTGFLGGDTANGKLTYLGGHDYSTALPITSNPQTNGVRLFLDSFFDSGCATTGGQPNPAVTLTKSAPASVSGGSITFTLNYANAGPGTADAAQLRDPVPVGTTFSSATGGGSLVGGEVVWNLGNLASGASGSVTFTVTVASDGTYTNRGTLYYATGVLIRSVSSNTTTTTRDTTAPDTSIVSGPAALTSSSSATFDFSSNEGGVTYECNLDGAGFVACTDPVTFAGLADGAHNLQARARDAAGNVDPSPAVHAWTIDATPPDTTIVSGPPANTGSSSATFDFSSSEGSVTYECSLDGGIYAACADPVTFTGLPGGGHSLQVRARDIAGNVDPTPAVHAWTVDVVAPDTTIVSGPAMLTNQSSATFDFSSNEGGVTYECSLDGGIYAACADPVTFAGLSSGTHNLLARARDAAGNVDPTPASYSWTVDFTPPDTSIVSGPPATSGQTTATFDFASNEFGVTYECSLDGAFYVACTDPVTFIGLGGGGHTLLVRARDGAGNVDPTPAMYGWAVDATAPETIIVSGPASLTTQTVATFDFSSDDPAATYECALDSAVFAACPDPSTFSGLASANHTLLVRARDMAGNVDQTPASRSWTIDSVAPDTIIVSGPAATTTSSTAAFDFSATEASVTYECSLDGGAFTACSDPATFEGLPSGVHSLSVRARDMAGNLDPSPAVHAWTVDLMGPDTIIVSGPPMVTNQAAATFDLSSNEANVTYECSLDGGAFLPCTDPATFANLASGAHTLSARARDAAGMVDLTPATYSWTIDTVPPDTMIVAAPPDSTSMTSATFDFTSNEFAVTYECSLDGAAYAGCTDPTTLIGLAEGTHTLAVRARDTAGNVDATPATRTWAVDTMAPDTTIVSGPGAISGPSATFDFSSSEMNVTYECRLDGAAFAPCTDPVTFANLAAGNHTLLVRAVDAAGNADPTPAVHTWTVDPTLLDTVIESAPPKNSNSAAATFDFSSNKANVTYECSLDGAPFSACLDPSTFPRLGEGPHRLEVRARDQTGMVDTTPAVYDWTIDTTPPDTTVTSGPPLVDSPNNVVFDFGATELNVTYECSLDGAAFAPCSDPAAFANLPGGTRRLDVRARDAAGNVDASPAVYTWSVLGGPGEGGAMEARAEAGDGGAGDARDGGMGDARDGGPGDMMTEGGMRDMAADMTEADMGPPPVVVPMLYGGGCRCDVGGARRGDAGSGWPLVLAPLAWLALRPRGSVRRRNRAGLPVALVGLGALAALAALGALGAGTARAQTPIEVPVANYQPVGTLSTYFVTDSGRTLRHLGMATALSMNYAHRPLELVDAQSDRVQSKVVRYQVNMDLVAALGLFDRGELAIALPVTLTQGSDDLAGIGRPGASLSGGLGDLRIIPKALLVVSGALSLGLAVPVSVPTGDGARLLGSKGVAVSPRATVGVELEAVALAANLGVRLRQDQSFMLGQQRVSIGNEAMASAGVRVPLVQKTLDLVADGFVAVAFAEQDREEIPAEALFGLRLALPLDIVATVGAGPGLTRGVGTPAFRVVGGLAYGLQPPRAAPRRFLGPSDPDKDGILGAADRCPSLPEDKDGFQDADGCPDPDNDQDRIIDGRDKCPNGPEDRDGFEDADGCPDPDNDQDAVADADDACPIEPEDKDGFKDADGCPDPDNDEDKIADAQDKCPDEPETVNQVDDEDGCPDKSKGPVQITKNSITVPSVYFATKKDVILQKSFPILLLVAKTLIDNTWVKKVRIEGHTDGQGDDQFNMDLSQRRAASVMRFLTENGVEQARVDSQGFGETQPIANNRTGAGRARNRRVEFIIVDPAPDAGAAPRIN